MPKSTPHTTRAWLRWLPVVMWAAVIFAGSSVPGNHIPGRYSVLGHISEYAVLGILVAFAERRRGLRAAAVIALAAVALYGASDELHQAFVPLRTPDVVDWMTDIAGAAIGVTVWALVTRMRARARDRARTPQ